MTTENEAAEQSSDNSYKVGYRRPPKSTRFKPGQSGNPRGRPKGTKNLKTDLMEELGEKIDIREGDRSWKVSKQRALLKSVVNRAIKGDARATNIALSTMLRLLDTGEDHDDVEEPLHDDEREILKAFEDSIRRRGNDRSAREDHRSDKADDPS